MKNFGINQVGVQIPKFQQPWRALQINRKGPIHEVVGKTIKPIIKKAAHYINEYGNQNGGVINYMINPVVDTVQRRLKINNSQMAAAGALAGTVASALGFKQANLLGVPDLIFDWAASIDEPENLRNHAHTATNYAEQLAKIVPGKLDDYVAKTGNFVSNLDDAFSAIGSDMYDSKLIARK